ncbi:MAG TPA: hypothetical protein VHV77_04965, partial [Pirellulales bacterium]|nr:hypothetical protein [Pirellulales bacterium]
PQGIGVLSLALELRPREMRMELIAAANYRIAQFRRRNDPLAFCHAHPSDDVQRWDRMSDEAKQNLRHVTPEDPLEVRLQAAGGTFTLVEVVDRLLEPFEKAGAAPRVLQDELFAYTVLRLKAGIDFDRRNDRDHWCTWLARLAQVEEAYHPSCGPNSMHLAEAVLNRLHWAAASQLGVAHMIADEPPHHPGGESPGFVEQKPGIVRDKYFVPYLAALLQKLTIHAALHDARQIADATAEELGAKLAEFRRELLQFGVRGYFAQVSTREALHRFYQLAQRGLDVPTNWQVLQRSLQELESSVNAEQQLEGQSAQLRQQQILVDQQHLLVEQQSLQRKLTTSMDENLHEIRSVQTFLHLLEYPLISVYFAHLWHMYADTKWPNDHDYVANSVWVAAGLGLVAVGICDLLNLAVHAHRFVEWAKVRLHERVFGQRGPHDRSNR